MAQYSKKRGVKYDQKKLSLEEKRKQWNIDLANRTLEQMFGCVEVGEDEIINNRWKKRVVYNAETLYEKGMEYFQNIVESNENNVVIVPDIEDFCMFCHISRTTFIKYRRGDDVELAEVANNIANAIASCKKQNAYQGLINPMAFMADMNNNHDYVQARTETTINSTISVQQVEANIADIASRIPMEDIPQIEKKGEVENG